MRKYSFMSIFIAICLVFFGFAGCVNKQENGNDNEVSSNSYEPFITDASGVDDSEQTHEATVAPSYSFSGGAEISTEGFESAGLGNARPNWLFETSLGCYCVYTDWEINENGNASVLGDFLMYSESAEGPWIKLCARPDCPHDNISCNAYVGVDTIIACYDGYIFYTLGQGIYRMNLDGSGHELLYHTEIFSSSGLEHYLDNGYLYVAIQDLYNDTAQIYRMALKKGAEPEIVSDDIDISGYQFMSPANGAIYIFRKIIDEKGKESYAYYRYSFIDGSYSLVSNYIEKYSIYYYEYDYILYMDHSDKHGLETGLYKQDTITGETTQLLSQTIDTPCLVKFDGEFTYIEEKSYDNPEKLFFYIYDSDFNLINRVQIPKAFEQNYTERWASHFAPTKDAVLFHSGQTEYARGIELNHWFPDYCLLKTDFYSDNPEFKKIEIFE